MPEANEKIISLININVSSVDAIHRDMAACHANIDLADPDEAKGLLQHVRRLKLEVGNLESLLNQLAASK